MTNTIINLKNNKNFSNIIKLRIKWVSLSFILYIAPTNQQNIINLGIISSKKVGNAIKRNYCKRKLRAIAKNNLRLVKYLGYNYVIIIKNNCVTINYHQIDKEFKQALNKILKNK